MLLSTSEVRRLVRAHGKLIRQQEPETLKVLLAQEQEKRTASTNTYGILYR